jgi:hypothetical protein
MMGTVKHVPRTPAPTEPGGAEATVAVELADGSYLLDDGRLAQQAVSCVIMPEQGDRVLVAACRLNENYIVHRLSRQAGSDAVVSVPGVRQLTIRQPQLALSATERLALQSLRDVDVTAATGVLSLNAHNLFSTVTESMVENVRHYVGSIEQYLLDVKQLLRLHGKQASITAENDVKVDAERISMG